MSIWNRKSFSAYFLSLNIALGMWDNFFLRKKKSIRSTLSSSTKGENWADQGTDRTPIQLTLLVQHSFQFLPDLWQFHRKRRSEPSWIRKYPNGVMSLKMPSLAIIHPFTSWERSLVKIFGYSSSEQQEIYCGLRGTHGRSQVYSE